MISCITLKDMTPSTQTNQLFIWVSWWYLTFCYKQYIRHTRVSCHIILCIYFINQNIRMWLPEFQSANWLICSQESMTWVPVEHSEDFSTVSRVFHPRERLKCFDGWIMNHSECCTWFAKCSLVLRGSRAQTEEQNLTSILEPLIKCTPVCLLNVLRVRNPLQRPPNLNYFLQSY